jgi:SAM-dependent methyltransferase
VGWSQKFIAASKPTSQSDLPCRVLRHLIFSHRLAVGSRVLDIGDRHGEFTNHLNGLGIEADGFEALNSESANEQNSVSETPAPSSYDMILVRESLSTTPSLLAKSTLKTTAKLLEFLKPGGHLVFLDRRPATFFENVMGHDAGCYTRHLSPFPGTVATKNFPDGLFGRKAMIWMLGLGPRSGHFMVSLRIPTRPLAREHWIALVGDASESGRCCDRQPNMAETTIPQRAAA